MNKVFTDVEDMLCKELGDIARKGELTSNNLDIMYKATDIVKDLYKIEAMKDYSNGYSGRYAREYSGARDYSGVPYGSYGGSYDGSYERRDSRGRYSGDGMVMEHLQKAMDESMDDKQRETIRKMMKDLQR